MNLIDWSPGTAILLLSIPFAVFAQQRPDFSGTWVVDPGRSASQAKTGPITLIIEQTPAVLTIENTGGEENFIRQYQLDGSENVHEEGVRSRARFNEGRLVINTHYPVRTLMGEWWVTSNVIRSLAAGGKEMVSETTVSIDHGYTFAGAAPPSKSSDIFVKQ